jgi:16S rRNA G966 N2-methylase RsmD
MIFFTSKYIEWMKENIFIIFERKHKEQRRNVQNWYLHRTKELRLFHVQWNKESEKQLSAET